MASKIAHGTSAAATPDTHMGSTQAPMLDVAGALGRIDDRTLLIAVVARIHHGVFILAGRP